MLAEPVLMGRKKKPADRPADEQYRKPFKPARIRGNLADLATTAAEALAQDFTQFVNDSVRMRLEGMGLWPPKRL